MPWLIIRYGMIPRQANHRMLCKIIGGIGWLVGVMGYGAG
jgi:hypothetical protein